MTTTATDENDPNGSIGSNADLDNVSALVSRRRLALHSLDYAPLAHERDVGGCCSALPLPFSPHRYRDANITMKVDGSLLNTPPMDISSLHQNAAGANGAPVQTCDTAITTSHASPLAVPEAGLHRDGEQARLVNMVRKRQQRQQQLQYQQMSTLQWINDSIWIFWETVVGSENPNVEESHKAQFEKHEHYADIVNPYRQSDRSARIAHDRDPKAGKTNNVTSLHQQRELSFHDSMTSLQHSRPRIIRVATYIYQRKLYALRWIIDVVLIRTTTTVRSCSENASSEFTRDYFHSPSYVLHFTADDVITSVILLWMGMFIGCRSQRVVVPVIVLIVLFGFVFLPKINGRVASLERKPTDHHLVQQTQSTKKFEMKPKNSDEPGLAVKSRTSSRSAKDTPQHLQAIQRLRQRFPDATHAECKRFYVCVKHTEEEAAHRIESWLQWRSDCGLKLSVDKNDTDTAQFRSREYSQEFIKRDEEVWNHAATLAMQIENKGGSLDTSIKLPQILCSYEEEHVSASSTTNDDNNASSNQLPPRAKDSTRIFHILPARIDLTLSPAPTYSLACALYLDRRLCRTNTEKITLLCDVRGGRAWANPTPWSMLPFIQATSSLLGKQYPERLERFILFPMPSAAAWIWSAAQKCLDPNTASKVVVVGVEDEGKSGGVLPEKLKEFIDGESLMLVEERRRSFFGSKAD